MVASVVVGLAFFPTQRLTFMRRADSHTHTAKLHGVAARTRRQVCGPLPCRPHVPSLTRSRAAPALTRRRLARHNTAVTATTVTEKELGPASRRSTIRAPRGRDTVMPLPPGTHICVLEVFDPKMPAQPWPSRLLFCLASRSSATRPHSAATPSVSQRIRSGGQADDDDAGVDEAAPRARLTGAPSQGTHDAHPVAANRRNHTPDSVADKTGSHTAARWL